MRQKQANKDFRNKLAAFGHRQMPELVPLESDLPETFSPIRSSLRIAGLYVLIGGVWILLSDRILALLVSDVHLLNTISVAKGWFFVLLTGLLLYLLIRRTLARIKKTECQLQRSYRERVLAHEELEQAYEEITATEEELRMQYEQLEEQQERLFENERKLEHLAYHDVLTGMPNKLALFERAAAGLQTGGGRSALLFLDIDNFKYINDTMGHDFGDELIVKACERLVAILDGQGTVYQFGGDEFLLLLPRIQDVADAEEIAGRILSEFRKALDIRKSLFHIGLSIGISLYPDHGQDMMELVKRADIAMYRAKETGKGASVLYDESMTDRFTERMTIEKLMYQARDLNEFFLVYQPQYDVKTGAVAGLEALVRWTSPTLGEVSPLKFIEVAEDTHLIIPLGTWVLKSACRELKKLHDQGYPKLTMSVNISLLQLMQTDFCEQVLDTLQEYGLRPDCLELELTESLFIESYDAVVAKLNVLREANVRIALDDFGTGYSSLSYLTHLPISTLKIDKSFIDTLLSDRNQAILVDQIIQIGKRIGMCTVAEGVEREEQLIRLQELGCDMVQGFLCSRPIPPAEVEALLAEQKRHHS
ncbi:putative bifunctional diguanylate cyclase/phosphodiesterase [Gorillibacterium timonense]|uniref:putative bifunctional diguanylate cyclase/phosphodiesterase n=1 Tax=Gorillibacterium timonense TaxID=1689269 RepID=UPI00071DA705|nr:EAL domain-containing protein [Gorillibacterium timonense]